MDSQKLAHSSSGSESHGVRVCHKCGWPFPNSHPSARHRRAHKKVCGSIEGYKLAGDHLEGSSHSNVSIDEHEHLSDEDHNHTNPNPKVSEGIDSQKSSNEAGVLLRSRSEDEVFSDAVSEFGDGKGAETVAVSVGALDSNPLVECDSIAEAVKPPGTTIDSIQVQRSETSESTSNKLTEATESTGPSVSDCQTETRKDVSLDNQKTRVIDVAFDSSSTLAIQNTDVEKNEETISDSNLLDVKVSPIEVAGATAKVTEPLPEKLPEDGFVCSKNPIGEVEPEGESIEHSVAYAHDDSVEINHVNSDHEIEKNGEVNGDVLLISVADYIHKVDDPNPMLDDFKDHKEPYMRQSATSENEMSEEKEFEIKGLVHELSSESAQCTAVSSPKSGVLVKEVAESQGSDREVMASQMDKTATESSPAEEEYNGITSDDKRHEITMNSVTSGDRKVGIEDDYAEKPVSLAEPSDLTEGEEQAVVSCQPAAITSDLGADPETDLDNVGKHEKIETENDHVTRDARHGAVDDVTDESGVDNGDGPTANGEVDNVVVAPKSSIDLKVPNVTCDHGIEMVKDPPIKTPESETHIQESQTVAENVAVSDTQLGEENPGVDNGLQEVTPALNSLGNIVKEQTLSPSDSELSLQKSPPAEDDSAKESNVSVFGSESFQGECDKPQLGGSVMDMSVYSGSRTDSLDNNWGSVSVLSLQSDAQAVIDTETVSPNESQAAILDQNNSEKGHHSQKSDMFEAPSFMTLVEPKGDSDQKSHVSTLQASQNPQQPNAASLQAGWFPSITHVAHESQGRKKNEEIIAKVTNWSAGGKQHTPLKNLLGEASVETRARSPKHRDVPQKGDKPAKTVNSILGPESPLAKPSKEIGREWDSPARYQTEIKREKRKPRSRPYWAQFMCCSSVH